MPGRDHPFLTGNTYHVFNKTIDGRRIFEDAEICQNFLECTLYYRSSQSILKFSNFLKLSSELKKYYENKIYDKRTFRISILSYTFMPTHYHFILRQNQKNGISHFISQIQNSFTRYLNIKGDRTGPIFLRRFKSKPILTDELFKHVSRYVHLNCFSSGIINDKYKLHQYKWSSFNEYTSEEKTFMVCERAPLLALFNNSKKRYKQFVLNNAEHQKMLEYCKYTIKW